jgi:DNA polymerase III subunit delta'
MSFAQFPEQAQVVRLLQRSLERGRLSHAYLLSGTSLGELEGVARTLAKTLNCGNPVRRPGAAFQSDCCDHCSSCHKIDEDNHPDIQWVRPESKSRIVTIDQMRELIQTISLKPSEAAWKVAVIVAADRLNVQAANAFLKTLEEPPPNSIILLLSTEPGRLLETVLSRCLRLNFSGESGPRLDPEYQAWVTSFSEMAVGRERSLLSRYRLLGALLAKLNEIKAETEKVLSARSPLERHDDIEPRLREKWEDELAAAVEAEYRRRRGDLLLALQWWLRDVWVQALALGQDLLSFPKLAAAAEAVGSRISAREALENIEVLEQTQRLLGSNVQEALALEVGLLKLKL